ncbi:hypothetical protein SDC9_44883 [bioreactor metagenome]|jgi:hypothetical protein|uniref:DUF6946 domain-containing protein n=1 Tax=bioreactor metagenome TaxID=1076179 RepID=A0A644W588_9ZZZZ
MFYIPVSKPEDWKVFLAQPRKQWKDGYSAKELAEAWQNALDFPRIVRNALASSKVAEDKEIEFIQGIPEYEVDLPGGSKASQNDLFVLARIDNELVAIMVEGKHREPFGKTIAEWKKDGGFSEGKRSRLAYLATTLGLPVLNIGKLRYQLFHRTVSAILTAQKYCTKKTIMLVHTFSSNNDSYPDYEAFAKMLGYKPEMNCFTEYKTKSGILLSLG